MIVLIACFFLSLPLVFHHEQFMSALPPSSLFIVSYLFHLSPNSFFSFNSFIFSSLPLSFFLLLLSLYFLTIKLLEKLQYFIWVSHWDFNLFHFTRSFYSDNDFPHIMFDMFVPRLGVFINVHGTQIRFQIRQAMIYGFLSPYPFISF